MSSAVAHPWNQSAVRHRPWMVWLLPSLTDFAFILPIFLLFGIVGGPARLFSDGDTGWHIRTGEWILAHKAVPVSDIFSFTKFGQPWFAWEWGCDVLFAGVHQFWGLAGVAFFAIVLLAAVSALLFRLVRRVSGSHIGSLIVTAFAICGSMIHWLARPHLFTWLFVLLFSHAVLSQEEGRQNALLALPLYMLLWVNLHGGFFIGILLLVVAGAGAMARSASLGADLRSSFRAARSYLSAAALCTVATFANPYGWRLHQHVLAYVSDSGLLSRIAEFQSPDFHQPGFFPFELLLVAGIAGACWCFERKDFGSFLWILVWVHGALLSGRNVPVFAFISAPYSAAAINAISRKLGWVRRFHIVLGSVGRELSPFERMPRSYLASACAVLAVGLTLAGGMRAQCRFDPERFPVRASQALERQHFSRVFTRDQWADYLIYRLYPKQKVFFDGRSDLFGARLLDAYSRISAARPGCVAQLANYGIDGVLVSPEDAIGSVLQLSPNWELIYQDETAVIYRAKSADNKTGGSVQVPPNSTAQEGGRKELAFRNELQEDEG